MNEDRAQELRQILAGSGSVTFIKSGQALSLRGDLVKNREYVRELTKLQVRKQRWGDFVCCLLGKDGWDARRMRSIGDDELLRGGRSGK